MPEKHKIATLTVNKDKHVGYVAGNKETETADLLKNELDRLFQEHVPGHVGYVTVEVYVTK